MINRVSVLSWLISAVAALLLVGTLFTGLGPRDVLRVAIAICGLAVACQMFGVLMFTSMGARRVLMGAGIGIGLVVYGVGGILGFSESSLTILIFAMVMMVGLFIRLPASRVERR
jgi:hypothetical protein